jgi:hypothetical protein
MDLDISDVLAEAEAALQVAQTAYETKKVPTQEEKQEILASGISGIFLGLIIGMAALMQMPDLELAVEPSIVPPLFAAVCSAAAVSASSSDGLPGKVTRAVLGKTTQNIGNLIKKSVGDAFASMVEKTTDHFKALPSRTAKKLQDTGKGIAGASVKKLQETAHAIPGKVKELAHRTTVQVVKEVKVSHSKVSEAATLKIKALAQHEEFRDGEDDTIVKPGLFFALPLVRRNKKAEKSRTSFRPTPPTVPPPLNML